ncbi:MAG TPA: hypothetical protein VMI56_06865 [Reyranella sp.]|nr:hypothetical protein [Reyranella sp.]
MRYFRRFLIGFGVLMVGTILLLGLFLFVLPYPYTLMLLRHFDPLAGCDIEVIAEPQRLAGADFEIARVDCALIGSNPLPTVFVARPGQSSKTIVFQYGYAYSSEVPYVPYPLNITQLDPHTVLISPGQVTWIDFAKQEWDGIEIKYAISGIKHPGPDDPPNLK